MKLLLSILLFLCPCASLLWGQPLTLTGKVLSSKGEPVSGATLISKDKSVQTQTDAAGTFRLPGVVLPVTLQISHIGYLSQSYTATRPDVTIILQEAVNDLDAVVVQGYGTTTRRYATGNIGKVSAAEIEKQPVTNPLAALQGRVPGVVISQTSGVPGSEFKIEIRGRSSLDASLSRNDPLYVIDNVPFEPGNLPASQISSAAGIPGNTSRGGLSPLNSINPADIESIEVLKDADATAIYGSRGANGVVLITTKRARGGKTKLQLGVSSGISVPSSITPMLNTSQYLAMRREAFANDGIAPTAANAPDLLRWDTTRHTDIRKVLIGNTARNHIFQASLSGGSSGTQYALSGTYNRQTNVFSPALADAIGSARLSVTHTAPDKKLSLNVSVLYSSDKNQLLSADLTQYLTLPSNIQLYDSLGNLNWGEGGVTFASLNLVNPLSILNRRYTSTNDNLSGNLVVAYQLLPGLSLRTSLGYNTFLTREESVFPKSAIAPTQSTLPSSQFAGSTSKSYILEPVAEYKAALGGGQLTALLGSTFQDRSFTSYQIAATNYTNDLLLGAIAAAGNTTASNRAEQYRYAALFGRLNYQWKNTYVLNLSGRRDASSRFGPDKRFANFGAAGAAWIFSGYGFVKTHLPFLSFGKLRASYGITGNDQIGNYRYLDLWSNTLYPYQGTPGLYPASLYNPDYAWEINRKTEGAVDLGFWKERLNVSVAHYRNRCSNQLVNYRLPAQTGFDGIGRNLPALVQNTGWELLLSGTPLRTKTVDWSVSLNLTIPRNRLVSFPGLANSAYATTYFEGRSLTQVSAYEYLGVNPETGIYTYRDLDGNGILNTRDRLLFGNLDPKLFGGLQNSLSYKGLSCSVFFEFRQRDARSYMDQLAAAVPGTIARNQPVFVLDRWQQRGEDRPVQRFTAVTSSAAYTAAGSRFTQSSGVYTDASYIRCKNVALSYHLPTRITRKARLDLVQVFLHAQNLFVLTPYKGSDPETANFYVLPPLRTFVAGIQITL